MMRNYSRLSRDELEARLDAAEDVCAMFGWTGRGHSEREKAAHEIWLRWYNMPGADASPEGNPHLDDDLIARLAVKRQATIDQTLASVRNEL